MCKLSDRQTDRHRKLNTSIFSSTANANDGTLSNQTAPDLPSRYSVWAVISPQGHWIRTSVSGDEGGTRPWSTA